MSNLHDNLDDIQGNVLAGFNCDYQAFVGFSTETPETMAAACQWLANHAQDVTSVAEVLAKRPLIRDPTNNEGVTFLCISISKNLLKTTQTDVFIRDNAFNNGMLKRAPSILGDRTNPDEWRAGSTNKPLDVFLIVAGNHKPSVEDRVTELTREAKSVGLVQSYFEIGEKIGGFEHFGFQDGVSQPRILDFDEGGDVGIGNFVFGYPRKAGGNDFFPVIDNRGVTVNGSLMVFRQLQQHVQVFNQFCELEAKRLRDEGSEITSAQLASLIVGRWPSGAPVRQDLDVDPNLTPQHENSFDFSDDAAAQHCPFGAHIRKVNPRNGSADVVDVPRILRRGIPFGKTFDVEPSDERGLLFICFQSSIKSQFEFITQRWMNSKINPGPGHDLLIGLSTEQKKITINRPTGPIKIVDRNLSWITPMGGSYFFTPSRSGLRKLAETPTPTVMFSARKLAAESAGWISESILGK
ncbi:Dyp-type peroxidase [Amylibacter sp. SFDW26]|uniref:Dyp-type peroxidase n=1 Tax=Amylibacter sp. SFDW26 TaxID=2652722 RepID=UPI0012628500|nr:Dyp-type peroxidase [Amylibacter sp. SFDW26]KAB7613630.1 Dyp-type peroxidase [Amylibacter sp. SFDW26]